MHASAMHSSHPVPVYPCFGANAVMVNRISLGSRAMNVLMTLQASLSNVAWLVGPWYTGPALRPSSSYSLSSTQTTAMKCVSTLSSMLPRPVAFSLELVAASCRLAILESCSSLSALAMGDSGMGQSSAKVLIQDSCWKICNGSGALRRACRRPMVPQAFPMRCLMNQTLSSISLVAIVSSSGALSCVCVKGYSMSTAAAGCGIMSMAQSSVEKTSTNSYKDVSKPSF
mmetsp:Transcript_9719/g.26497  ORF Transcript_9719/g.26497 Transcript_9719/m.26497 type:complete len:228 (-) Transcript_9719:370-1053(-)